MKSKVFDDGTPSKRKMTLEDEPMMASSGIVIDKEKEFFHFDKSHFDEGKSRLL